jgi:hypothetical protein
LVCAIFSCAVWRTNEMKKYLIASVAVLLLALLGCREDASDERVIEAAVKQDKHTGDIATLSTRIEGFENRLAGIEKSLQKVPEPTGSVRLPPISRPFSSN